MRLVILGAGGYGRTIADLAEQSGKYNEVIFLDDYNDKAAGKCEDYKYFINPNTEFYPAFGNNEMRREWIFRLKEADVRLCSLIHSSAYVSPTAKIGNGTMVLPNASVGTNVRIGDGCIINMNSVIDHDCLVEDGAHICLGAVVKSGIIIKEIAKIEASQVIEKN